ncbi:concanavalin A-like lectin/glucanase domain-containing protein [Immersiella caudata]|uniref:Concanavalin A-like lectin/glucanase domain-containing protein n=1 Tax=Immersiella caudata TaxID=314043 RepID=A0AA39WWK3_9PEZI|nr:concanavalin A-like lectin/glucanase domain-containing protein [Immersiella caudata]
MTSVDIAANTDWDRQKYNVTAEKALGPFGKMMDVRNVELIPSSEFEPQKRLLKLVVNSSIVDGMVSNAEMASTRTDIMHGTFSVSMKTTDIPGTCQAFFWYFNDTQEIDMEFLSKEFNNTNSSWPVNLVLHTRESIQVGYDSTKVNPNYWKAYLPFNPAEDYHVYRFDYFEDRVSFYMDDILLKQLEGQDFAIPTGAGHLVLQHWSNGDPHWSAGPPQKDAEMLIRWVKAYFNSSNPDRLLNWQERCGEFTPKKLCIIPSADVNRSKETGRGLSWFYTEYEGFANNQIFFRNLAPRQQGWAKWQIWMLVLGWVLMRFFD